MEITPGTRFGHFEIRSAIGAGGQASVYKATDVTLGRNVVIKVLSPEQTAKAGSLARFEREAKLASSLDHPNICTIHGLFSENGVRYIAMQYVEGRNVRQLVAGRPLDLRSALSIAIQVADALAAAHERGIIHRDIKAGNVMVTEAGMVKVLDFGLAKLLEDSGEGEHDPHLTQMGVPYGTATYAAPEQATGGQVDHRADIFSTGVLLYEMLTGTWPFKGKSVVEVRYAVLKDKPRPIAVARGEDSAVIARLQEIVDRALAKEPAARYQRMSELRGDLREVLKEIDPATSQGVSFTGGIAPVAPRHHVAADLLSQLTQHRKAAYVILAALLLSGALGILFYARRAWGPAVDSLAVLPFTNVNADQNTEYLSDGITESLINSLSQLTSIRVSSRNAVFHYKGQDPDPRQVRRDLGVGAVLSGLVERRGDQIAVSVELIDARDDSHIWGERYARRLADLPTLQEDLSRDITAKLKLRLSGAEQRQLVKDYATNSEAYQLYLEGRYYWHRRSADGLRKGIEYFTRAIEKDRNYAPAYSGLADCYSLLNVYDIEPATESDPKAREAAVRALDLDETLAEAHASLATVTYRYDWNWADAERHFKRAIQLNPDYATAHQWYSALLAAEGRFDEANAEAQRAHLLDPFSLTVNTVVGRRLYYARQYERALAVHRETIEMDPRFVRGHAELGDTLIQIGRTEEAIGEFQKALALDAEWINGMAGLGYAYAVSGERAKAEQIIQRLRELGKRRYVSPYHEAVVYAGLGEKEKALDYLEKAAEERYDWLVFIQVEPMFDSLRSEPRFSALVRRVGLASRN